MIHNQKMPYEAPESDSIMISAENLFCNNSTGERFGNRQDYSGDWTEED